MTDEALLKALGERLAGLRLARNLTQQELAEQAGLGLRTVQRLESGAAATQLSGLLRVCRVLGLVEQLDTLIPEPHGATEAARKPTSAGLRPAGDCPHAEEMDLGRARPRA
jgi:transcriptional regulator with XRE-family HTH domain